MMVPEAADAVSTLWMAGSPLEQTADSIAGSLFGASLFPWLAMLYWLGHEKTQAPPGVVFGLQFLLVFVFASIPAAIGAGALYGLSLADSDYLHGAAESLLAITNCVVVLGFREALNDGEGSTTRLMKVVAPALGAVAFGTAVAAYLNGASAHEGWLLAPNWQWEPANALSLPTWVIHTSSLVEWLVAMGLCWKYAEKSGDAQWRGVTWGMLPLHTSGIVACTYHLFYNNAALAWCIPLQALTTCLGNTTLAYACYRLAVARGWTWADVETDARALLTSADDVPAPVLGGSRLGQVSPPASLRGWEDLGEAWQEDLDLDFIVKLLSVSLALAFAVKLAPAAVPELALGPEALSAAALLVIAVPTALNAAKWQQRSEAGGDFKGDF